VEAERFRSIGKSWWRILSWYEGWVLRNCDYVFCITETDSAYMIEKMNVGKERCVIVPYGINEKSSPTDKETFKLKICQRHGLNPDIPLLFFNGLLDYKPNLEALDIILEKIHPILKSKGYVCNMLIAGKRLPASYNQLKSYNKENIYYAGFVDDINEYTKAADILLNPVITGGGVKTKMIEALSLNTVIVSTKTGATGIDPQICGGKVIIADDKDVQGFANAVINTLHQPHSNTPAAFYQKYYWGNIIQNILESVRRT
jgi:glycosyltransferase involved in cell wall biosynthesis